MTTTPILFFGPTGEESAQSHAKALGRVLGHYPAPLKVDAARELVGALLTPPVGDLPGVYTVDLTGADDKVQDTLLKTLEDPPETRTFLVLYAQDTQGIRDTVLSRLHPRWCPGSQPLPMEAIKALKACKGDPMEILQVIKKDKKSLDFYTAVSSLVADGDLPLKVWQTLREMEPTKVSVLYAVAEGLRK